MDAGDAGDAGDVGTADAGDVTQAPTSSSQTTSTSTATTTATTATATQTTDTTSDELLFTEITDVDLAPTGEYALAVFRDRRTVLKVPIPEAFEDLDAVSIITVGEEIIGSVNIAPEWRARVVVHDGAGHQRAHHGSGRGQ